jgi:hypothetical protein
MTILYFGIIGVVIFGVIHVAHQKLQQSFETFTAEDWAGNYVIVEKLSNGSAGTLFTKNGTLLGQVIFTPNAQRWTITLDSPTETIQTIVYNGTGTGTAIGFNATCRANGTTTPCLIGGLGDFPSFDIYQGYHATAEYANTLTFDISATGLPFAAIPSNGTEVTTGPQNYQGVGDSYPPLGSWAVGNTPVLDVMWSMNSSTACAGLRVNLSENDEVLAWPVVGLIWQWWIQWGEGGGCSWS